MAEPSIRGDRTSSADSSEAALAARAFEIWESAGRPDGQADEHWYQAERELNARRNERGEPRSQRNEDNGQGLRADRFARGDE